MTTSPPIACYALSTYKYFCVVGVLQFIIIGHMEGLGGGEVWPVDVEEVQVDNLGLGLHFLLLPQRIVDCSRYFVTEG